MNNNDLFFDLFSCLKVDLSRLHLSAIVLNWNQFLKSLVKMLLLIEQQQQLCLASDLLIQMFECVLLSDC